jgi:outer membrane lipoprotein SlyB
MMIKQRRWRAIAAAAALVAGQAGFVAAPVLFSGTASAQPAVQVQTPRVTAFDVRPLDRIEPGGELEFTLWGTPGAEAVLSIDGAQRVVRLAESSPGVYQGVYTIGVRDRIAPDSRVTANLRRGNRVGTALLDEALQRGWAPAPVAGGDMPRIDRFSVTHGGERRIGAPIHLTLIGTPGARVTAHLPGATQRRVLLREVRAGEYVGTYTVQSNDRFEADEPVVARMRLGDRVVTTRLDNALDRSRLQYSAADPALCGNCGKVIAINRIEIDGDGRYIGGTVVGGLLGAAIGSQIGGGDGRTAAGVVGAVGGALIGREIEKRRDRNEAFEVVIQLTNGQRHGVVYEDSPPLRVGDNVRIEANNRLERI